MVIKVECITEPKIKVVQQEQAIISLCDKKDDLRRKMYVRIAHGNALAELEEDARRYQQGL